jgi:alkaline phosphatase D
MSKQSERSDVVNRRGFLKSLGTTSVAGGLAALLAEREIAAPVGAIPGGPDDLFAVAAGADPDETFPQSIASGGPTPSGVILWTRIAPAAYNPQAALGVEVATDDAFDDLVYRGTVDAAEITPQSDYTIKVDLDGELASDTRYYYRFVYDDVASRTGRCKTLPEPDADVDEVSFAFVTCQDYQNGYYGAYHHIAEEDVDFVVHLGDYIYESAGGEYQSPLAETPPGREISLPSGASLAESLADFRHLYKTYKRDPLLQRGHEHHTFIHGWDDHEIGNNRYWDYDAGAPVLPDKDNGDDPEFALNVTADGIQAWTEYIPARVEYNPEASELHEQLRLWRDYQFGDLVDLSVTDERLFRDGPPCDGLDDKIRVTCTEEEAADRTMLGDQQKAWWKSWVDGSEAAWTVWANEVMTMPLTAGDGFAQVEFFHDSWDGFQYERWELMQHVKAADPENFVTLTGDLHASLAGYQLEDYGEVDWNWWTDRVGIEFMTPSITSVNAADVVDFPGDWDDDALSSLAKAANDHLQYADFHKHGYAVIEFTRTDATYTVYDVDITENSADAQRTKHAQYRTPSGEERLEEITRK